MNEMVDDVMANMDEDTEDMEDTVFFVFFSTHSHRNLIKLLIVFKTQKNTKIKRQVLLNKWKQ